MDGDVVDILCRYLELETSHVFRGDAPLDLSFLSSVADQAEKKIRNCFLKNEVPQQISSV